MSQATLRLVAARENAVYEATEGAKRMALRLHRKGYRTDHELQCELEWMSAASRGGLSVPAPIRALSGAFLIHVDGVQIDAVSWLTGDTLTNALPQLSKQQQVKLFHALGQTMARLHQISDAWQPPTGFARVHWDYEGLLGETPLWNQFWNNPDLTKEDRSLFLRFRDRAREDLGHLSGHLDYGLIHADLVPGNVLYDGQSLHLIDFDDGGYGFRLFEIATALLKHRGSGAFPDLKAALLTGYSDIRDIDLSALPLFSAIRAATYVGWNIDRMGESGGIERNQRFIETLRDLASEYLSVTR
jgi:Ser/Thr protein kinase RdoA (MazF antagonist)